MSHFSAVLHANVSEAASGESKVFDIVPGSALALQLNVTARNDSSSTLDVVVQDSLDNGLTWNTIATFSQATNTTREIKTFNSRPYGRKVKAVWTIAGDEAAVKASLATSLTGTNNDLDYTADTAGTAGNSISVRYVDPASANASLSVSVSGKDITVNLATDGSNAITSTAAQVKAAIEAVPAAAALVDIANHSGNDGSGVVTALAKTNLSGGLAPVDSAYTFAVHAVAR